MQLCSFPPPSLSTCMAGFCFPCLGFLVQSGICSKRKDVRKKKHRGNRVNEGRSCETNEAINKNSVLRKKVEMEKEPGGTPHPEVLIDVITGTLML